MKKYIFSWGLIIAFTHVLATSPDIPIFSGRFYTDRSPRIDTIFLPVDQEYVLSVSLYRYVDSIQRISIQNYINIVHDFNYVLGQSNIDLEYFQYRVINYKELSPMFICVYDQIDSISRIFQKKTIDVIFYDSETIYGCCYEKYKTNKKTIAGENLLKYIDLLKFYLQQKIEKEITIVSKESGDLLIDTVDLIIMPNKKVVINNDSIQIAY